MAKNRFEFAGGVWRKKRKIGTGLGGKLVLVAVLGSIGWSLNHPTASAPVTLVSAERKNFDIWVKSVGNVQAAHSVVVHPQVAGQIAQLMFTEGQEVKKGDVLATLDPSLYRSQLAQAIANKQQDEAQAEAARYQLKLQGTPRRPATPRQEALQTSIHQFEAAIKSDDASIQQAQAQLDYTTITAPMDGRVGIKRIDAGNIIQPSDPEGLVEITQMEKVAVLFNVPETNMQAVARSIAAKQPIRVTAHDMATDAIIAEGTLELADNQVNTGTGNMRMKALFDNQHRILWPGAMVGVQLTLGTMNDALVVPVAALVRRGEQHFVYKVDTAQKQVSLYPVNVRLTQGDDAVIADGLKPGDQLAIDTVAAQSSAKRVAALSNIAPAR